jgi:hypothetical protein
MPLPLVAVSCRCRFTPEPPAITRSGAQASTAGDTAGSSK